MAKKKTEYKPKPKADIDFENELWEAANELRGAVAENQYKDFVLSLLLVKLLTFAAGSFAFVCQASF